jgi:tetratricopeptide (TPR) repeat protein
MAAKRPSLQDRIRDRQRGGSVGRQEQVMQYQENLGFPPDDERRQFLFNIHGDAGVGKTYLTRQLQQIATSDGSLAAYVDETVEDANSAMIVIAEQFRRAGSPLSEFDKRAAEYQQRRHELESDQHAPEGLAAFITKTAVTIGLAATRDIPVAGSLLAPLDAVAAAEQVNQARIYLARKFSDHADVRLLLSPADELTPVFVAGVNRVAAGRTVALFFDTYERTGPFLDFWLRGLYSGRYGDLPETLITTVSGQKPLSPNLWGDYLPVTADIPLEPFSEDEARRFLASKGITAEPTIQVILTLSGRLPLWLATLADAHQQGRTDIGDPSGNAVERFLKWEDDPARREVAMAAALPRVLNQDVLAVLTAPKQARELFGWLRELPFVSRRGEAWVYHDVVRAAMMRMRRAEAPAEWRSQHNLLARANSEWANEAAQSIDGDTWANSDWVDYIREEMYHLLCADPQGNLPKALASAVKAAKRGSVHASQWAGLITDAGHDTNNDQLSEFGKSLRDGIRDGDFTLYFTELINKAGLDEITLAVAFEERGQCHRLAGRYDETITDLTQAIELNPSSVLAITLRGIAYWQAWRYDEALPDLNRAIELNPNQNTLWAISTVRGAVLYQAGRYDEALPDLNRAIELNPNRDTLWATTSVRGIVHWRAGRYDEALPDLNRSIELNPDQAWIIEVRGEVYRATDRHDEAIADLTRAIKLNPTNIRNIFLRGLSFHDSGRYDEAIADLTRTIELNPDRPTLQLAITVRGLTYYQTRRYDEALPDLTRAIELDPGQPAILTARGEAYRLMDRYDEALADFDRAIELDPGHAAIAAARGEAYRFMGRYEEALADFDRAIELDPAQAVIIRFRSEVYRAMGRHDEAIADLTRAIELDPAHP